MYSNKENVNILTALLVAHGVRHAVVCPGSRNAPIVHNLNECPAIQCYPVTDERSAGFYALGMTQALHEPVAVCVTSGTALLNLAPAVAEAYYQHLPLIVISADRPQQWIDQLDGQTLLQLDALGRFVAKAVTLPEIPLLCEGGGLDGQGGYDELRWYANRLANETLLETTGDTPRPVHINVPISEPLFNFTVEQLPQERMIQRFTPSVDYDGLPFALVEELSNAHRPLIVFGQVNPNDYEGDGVEWLFSHVIVLHESLAKFPSVSHFDEVLYAMDIKDELLPDFILYVGNCIVSKRLRHFLRRAKDANVWRISPTGDIEDTFMHLHGLIVGDAEMVLQSLSQKMRSRSFGGMQYRRWWLRHLMAAGNHALTYEPAYSQMAAVRYFEQQLHADSCHVHYANSTAIRLANVYAQHHVWCNRGVNGIEGSLSTACGFSVVTDDPVYCVIGDLSFFYDQNALWNQNLRGNLRILLLNNGRGGIFDHLPGLDQSPARDRLVAAEHHTTAEGICCQNNIAYLEAHDAESMRQSIGRLLRTQADRPMLLEVFTDSAEDTHVLEDYYQALRL